MFICGLIIIYKVTHIKDLSGVSDQSEYHYAWVIPSYKESEEVISITLNQLASHSKAKNNYIICLAMEAHEVGSA